MGYAIEVDGDNFKAEVIEKSYLQTVILDFHAVWCGPCKLLKPMLEKLAIEYDFILAKVDIDKDPDLASQYGVEGVPDVRIVSKGEILPGFVGALPEAQLRDLLARLDLKSELESGLEKIQEAIAIQDFATAKELFDRLFSQYPDNLRVAIMAVKFLIRLGKIAEAKLLLETIQEDNSIVRGFKTLLEFHPLSNPQENSEFDGIFFKGIQLALQEKYEEGLEQFLAVVKKSHQYRKDGARKAIIAVFNLLGVDHPLTKQYQEKLTLILY